MNIHLLIQSVTFQLGLKLLPTQCPLVLELPSNEVPFRPRDRFHLALPLALKLCTLRTAKPLLKPCICHVAPLTSPKRTDPTDATTEEVFERICSHRGASPTRARRGLVPTTRLGSRTRARETRVQCTAHEIRCGCARSRTTSRTSVSSTLQP